MRLCIHVIVKVNYSPFSQSFRSPLSIMEPEYNDIIDVKKSQ
jgi:hypothetical protein